MYLWLAGRFIQIIFTNNHIVKDFVMIISNIIFSKNHNISLKDLVKYQDF